MPESQTPLRRKMFGLPLSDLLKYVILGYASIVGLGFTMGIIIFVLSKFGLIYLQPSDADQQSTILALASLGISFIVVVFVSMYLVVRRKELQIEREISQSELQKLEEQDFAKYDQITQLREQKARADFERNLKSTFILGRVETHGLSFFANSRWVLQPGVNVVLGRNGYGKSLILRSLAALLQHDEERSADLLRDAGSYLELRLKRNADSALIRRESDRFTESVGKVPILAIPDARFSDRGFQEVGPSQDSYAGLREHGAHHFLGMESYSGIILGLIYEICLDYWEHGRSFRLPVFRFFEDVFRRLTDERLEFASIERSGRTSFEIRVKAEGIKEPVPIRYASQGTLSVLAIFGLVRSYLRALFPDEAEGRIAEQPAVVIIDELDAHLHPVWQQRMTGLLREMFPRVQFIVSAHSPLVAAGCLKYEVAILRKSPSGFVVQQFERDFVGASIQELYEELFDIDEPDETLRRYPSWKPMDNATQKHINDLNELESAGKLTAADRLERARLLRESHLQRRVAEVLEERQDKKQDILTLEAEVERLQDRVKELGGDGPAAEEVARS